MSIKAKQVAGVTTLVVLVVAGMTILQMASLTRVRIEETASRAAQLKDAILHRAADRVNGVRLRYHAPERACRLEPGEAPDEATVALAEPVDGAAPGQVACLMDGDLVVGHGTIV